MIHHSKTQCQKEKQFTTILLFRLDINIVHYIITCCGTQYVALRKFIFHRLTPLAPTSFY